jgi:hemerythrin-like domain-containing protein
MSGLDERRDIVTCREHHAHIEDLLTQLPPMEVENAAAIVEILGRLKTLLLRHLRFEDEHLYPRLQRSADPVVVETATRYQSEMGGLAPVCVAFFESWSTADFVRDRFNAFTGEWATVRNALERRVAAEDNELYALAERS